MLGSLYAAPGAGATWYYGYNNLTPGYPYGRCDHVLPGSHSLACAGWNYWNANQVYKLNGGWIRVGYWDVNRYMHYTQYCCVWAGPPITQYRSTSVGGYAPAYNAATCAYDYTYAGNSSYVRCEAF